MHVLTHAERQTDHLKSKGAVLFFLYFCVHTVSFSIVNTNEQSGEQIKSVLVLLISTHLHSKVYRSDSGNV